MYTDIASWTDGLDPRSQRQVASRLREGTLDYNITLVQAEDFDVRVAGKLRKLSWVAEHNPKRLELLMNTVEPGSVLFNAITLVYNANIGPVLLDVQEENDRIREASATPKRQSLLRVRLINSHRVYLRE